MNNFNLLTKAWEKTTTTTTTKKTILYFFFVLELSDVNVDALKTRVINSLVCFLGKKLILYSTIFWNVNEARIQKCHSLLTINCLDVAEVSQDNRFRCSSSNAKDKASSLTIFSSKMFKSLKIGRISYG